MNALFPAKPWEFKGRRMERNAPSGTLCSRSPWCVAPRPRGNMAHCTVCHQTYSGIWAFDRHRKDGWCLDPKTLKLAQDFEGVWRSPAMASDYKDHLNARVASRSHETP